MTYKIIISTVALLGMLSFGATLASASVVTGTLSSSGVSSSQMGTTGTLSGTVSNPVVASNGGGGGGGGGSGGGGVISGPLAVGATNGGGSAGTGVVSNPPGVVLGVSTDVPNTPTVVSAGNIGTSGAQTQAPLALNTEVATPQGGAAFVAAVAASGTGTPMWWFWLAFVLLLIAAAYAGWRYYQDNYKRRGYSR